MLLIRSVRARNTAPDSDNPIHTEEAKAHGFRGGIVPGLTLYNYATRPLVERWGTEWLDDGELGMRFSRPVYDGEQLDVRVTESDAAADGVDVSIVDSDGNVRASGAARRRGRVPRPQACDFPAGERPDPLPIATSEELADAGPLPELAIDTSADAVGAYMTLNEEDHPVYSEVVHPGAIARVSAYILSQRFQVNGPRIHRGLVTTFYGAAPIGAPIVARGRIDRVWEHNGHGYVSTELVAVDDHDDVLMHIRSEAIWRLGA